MPSIINPNIKDKFLSHIASEYRFRNDATLPKNMRKNKKIDYVIVNTQSFEILH